MAAGRAGRTRIVSELASCPQTLVERGEDGGRAETAALHLCRNHAFEHRPGVLEFPGLFCYRHAELFDSFPRIR